MIHYISARLNLWLKKNPQRNKTLFAPIFPVFGFENFLSARIPAVAAAAAYSLHPAFK